MLQPLVTIHSALLNFYKYNEKWTEMQDFPNFLDVARGHSMKINSFKVQIA
jgi:hypothetical protein